MTTSSVRFKTRVAVTLFEGREIGVRFFLDDRGPQAVLRGQLLKCVSNGEAALLEGRIAT